LRGLEDGNYNCAFRDRIHDWWGRRFGDYGHYGQFDGHLRYVW